MQGGEARISRQQGGLTETEREENITPIDNHNFDKSVEQNWLWIVHQRNEEIVFWFKWIAIFKQMVFDLKS